jgi:Integrase core domain
MYSGWPEVRGACNVITQSIIAFFDKLATIWGYPRTILSDNGSQFTSTEFNDFCKRRDIKHERASVYNPTTNGKVERFNQVLKSGLTKMLYDGAQSAAALDAVLRNYRTTPHTTIGCTPAKLMLDRELRNPLTGLAPPSDDDSHRIDDNVRQHVKQQQRQMKR